MSEDQTKNTGSDRGSQTSPLNPYRDEEYEYSETPGLFHARPERVREDESERDVQGNPVRYFADGSTVKPVNRAQTEAHFGYEAVNGEFDERTEGRTDADHIEVDAVDGEVDDERQVVSDDEDEVGTFQVDQDDASGWVPEATDEQVEDADEAPAKNASKADWVEYAEQRGEDVEGLTRDEIIDFFESDDA